MTATWLGENRRAARSWTYGILVATLLGSIVIALAAERVDGRLIAVSLGVVVAAVVALEVAISLAMRRAHRFLFADEQLSLFPQLGGLSRLFGNARQHVEIIAGTGHFLTLDEANVRALDVCLKRGVPARILMMHPDKTGLEAYLASRLKGNKPTTEHKLVSEIHESLAAIANVCGTLQTVRVVRLYDIPRNWSLYRFDDDFVITLNLPGRGASSPAFFVRRGPATKAFCDNVLLAFDVLWDGGSAVSHDLLNSLLSTAANAPTPIRSSPPARSRP